MVQQAVDHFGQRLLVHLDSNQFSASEKGQAEAPGVTYHAHQQVQRAQPNRFIFVVQTTHHSVLVLAHSLGHKRKRGETQTVINSAA